MLRLVEFANAATFLFLASLIDASDFVGPRSRSEIVLANFVLFLAASPFFVAFVMSFRKELTDSQWLLMRAPHQALAIVAVTIAVVSLVGLPDTVRVTICIVIMASLQLAVLKVTGKSLLRAPGGAHWPITALRLAMVFLFAFVFLLLK
ncbi:MAG: hypothetical protein WA609_05125 [Terriglobales bacterium]